MNILEHLFNPNYVFNGNASEILKNYPKRSQNLEQLTPNNESAKNLNKKFIKDNYMYLLRGALNGQESGFYSQEYAKGNTIESLGMDPYDVAYAQFLNGNTPFISTTTYYYTAAAFSKKEKIYIIKVKVDDVYTFYQDESLEEKEYMIPDYISNEEIIKSFRYDKLKQIFNYLKNEVGLEITPEDLGVTEKDLEIIDMDILNQYIAFNVGDSFLDYGLSLIQDSLLYKPKQSIFSRKRNKKKR